MLLKCRPKKIENESRQKQQPTKSKHIYNKKLHGKIRFELSRWHAQTFSLFISFKNIIISCGGRTRYTKSSNFISQTPLLLLFLFFHLLNANSKTIKKITVENLCHSFCGEKKALAKIALDLVVFFFSSRHLGKQKRIFHMFDYDYIFCCCSSACLFVPFGLLQPKHIGFWCAPFCLFQFNFSYFLSFVILAPVIGNFTEEEANGNNVPQDTLEYPLQRDEVHTQNAKGDRNHQIPSGMYAGPKACFT